MKLTGPIDTQSLYRSVNGDQMATISLDDKYWVNHIEKNFRKQDQYKLPSGYTWDHKKYGVIGEIVDLKSLERKEKLIGSML